MRALPAALALLALLGAAPAAGDDGPRRPVARPDRPAFGAALPVGTTAYSNESLAELFVTLTHDFEWGGRRPHLVRYEGPISVGLSGPGAERYAAFVDDYLAQLRARAGIPIALGAAPHNLAVRFVSGDQFRERVPRQYCLVAPGAPGWDEFSESPRRYGTRAFETQAGIRAMTVFVPDSAPAYLARGCLIEEIAQALGAANDLYGLGPTIFNDDAAHVWPTKLDYLMLRVLYAPEMHTGLSRRETGARALALLDRLNPEGLDAPPLPPLRIAESAEWTEAMRAAFDRSRSDRRRRASAQKALAIAAAVAPGSAQHCRSLQALARASADDPEAALEALADAALICAVAHGGDDIRLARIRLDRARLLYRLGRPGPALGQIEGLEARFAAYGQEEPLTALYEVKAAILGALGEAGAAAEARRLAAEWRAYALGTAADDPTDWTAGAPPTR